MNIIPWYDTAVVNLIRHKAKMLIFPSDTAHSTVQCCTQKIDRWHSVAMLNIPRACMHLYVCMYVRVCVCYRPRVRSSRLQCSVSWRCRQTTYWRTSCPARTQTKGHTCTYTDTQQQTYKTLATPPLLLVCLFVNGTDRQCCVLKVKKFILISW